MNKYLGGEMLIPNGFRLASLDRIKVGSKLLMISSIHQVPLRDNHLESWITIKKISDGSVTYTLDGDNVECSVPFSEIEKPLKNRNIAILLYLLPEYDMLL